MRSTRLALSVVPLALALACGQDATLTDFGDESHDAPLTGTAPDANTAGPYGSRVAEYRFPAETMSDVLPGRRTELWASVHLPSPMPAGKRPLVVFLHGNHGTCGRGSNPRSDDSTQYTTSGTCPAGYVPTPNHRGYDYLAQRLNSWGFVVVSINANRGITAAGGVSGDFGLNLARGRLVLKHLERLSAWHRGAQATPSSLGASLEGKLDLTRVGFMGHSRGGEGVRAAYNQYLDRNSPWPAKLVEPLTVRGIFEIGPVDGQTSRVLDALGTAWNVLLPLCDGDVSDLQGMQPYDRMSFATREDGPAPKSMVAVWGANHNFYNTEWQEPDSDSCAGQRALFDPRQSVSTAQQETGLSTLVAFFRAHLGSDEDRVFLRNFDPQYGSPAAVTQVARLDRTFADSADQAQWLVLEDFTGEVGRGSRGFPHVARPGVTVSHGSVPEHDDGLRAARVTWRADGGTALDITWAGADAGVDVRGFDTFDFRVSRAQSSLNPSSTNFRVALINAAGTLTPSVPLTEYATLSGDPGHVTLQTVRIPLGRFRNASLDKVRGVRFSFTSSRTGSVYLADLRASKAVQPAMAPAGTAGTTVVASSDGPGTTTRTHGNTVVAFRKKADGPAGALTEVEVELQSDDAFVVADALPLLLVGDQEVALSRYPDDGDTRRLIFSLTPTQYAALRAGDPVTVQYGKTKPRFRWTFAPVDGSQLTP